METIDSKNLVTATGGFCGPHGCVPAYGPYGYAPRPAPRWAYGPAAYGPAAYGPWAYGPRFAGPAPRFWY
jgi:hypothetical protein